MWSNLRSYLDHLTGPRNTRNSVALTYANDVQLDGAAAQLQRIYGIYALSREFGVYYAHSPIKEIGYQGIQALEKNAPSDELTARYNRLFEIKSDLLMPSNAETSFLDNPSRSELDALVNASKEKNQPTLARIRLPYKILDAQPEIYRLLSDLHPIPITYDKVFRIAIHLRRGDLIFKAPGRMLPNSYYIDVALKICDILSDLGIEFSCDLYSESPTKRFIVHSKDKTLELDPNQDRFEEFNKLPNLRRFINFDQIETLKQMIAANALIMSRSSFSYFAALLNNRGAIFYHPFWHSPLGRWFVVKSDISEETVSFSYAAVRQHFEEFSRNN